MNVNVNDIKGIIFDYGGTLDSGGDHWSHIIKAGWEKAGVVADDALFREAYVYAERELARTLHILPHHTFKDLLDIKIQIELQYLCDAGHFPPQNIQSSALEISEYCYKAASDSIDKIRPVLEELSKKFPLVLVSNFYGNINSVLKDFKLDSYFKEIIESAVVGIRKPIPEIFSLGVKALKLNPSNVLVIGDSLKKDILPAEEAGCQALWLKGKGWSPEEDAAFHPNIITELEEVLQLFDGK